jgi:two-component system, NarL family, invasion response regulator UvrY
MTRVLIADDHEIVRHGLRDILTTRLGGKVTVAQAKDAGEAISRLTENEWDLVLLDINMPGRDGLEVLEEARRLRPKTPVLVLTSYPEEEFAVRAFKLGAAGYLTKQGASDELITAARRILAGGKYVTASLAERLASNLGAADELAPHEALSHRELQVLRLVAVGKSTKEIAADLALSEKTVATYRTRISEKTGLKTNVEIARYALKQGLVE